MTARDDIDWDELRKMLQARDDKKVELPEPAGWVNSGQYLLSPIEKWELSRSAREFEDQPIYLSDQLESYAAARVAEATAELRSEIERVRGWNERVSVCRDHTGDIVDNQCIVCQRDELQRRVAELEAFVRGDLNSHPRREDDDRDEVELFLRDAYAAGCNAIEGGRIRDWTTAAQYANREAPKLRILLANREGG